jgi:hypothetical protein
VRQPVSPEEGTFSVALTDSGAYWTLVLPVVPIAAPGLSPRGARGQIAVHTGVALV